MYMYFCFHQDGEVGKGRHTHYVLINTQPWNNLLVKFSPIKETGEISKTFKNTLYGTTLHLPACVWLSPL